MVELNDVSYNVSNKLDLPVKRLNKPSNRHVKPRIWGHNKDEKKEVGLKRLMGVVGVGLGVIFYLLHEGAPTPEHTLLLRCHSEQVNCNLKEEIRSVMEMMVVNKTRTLIGSWSWEQCDFIEAAASIGAATVVAWDCPSSEIEAQGFNYRAIPKLTTIGAATVQTLKHLRFKSVSLINLDAGMWPHLKLITENLLLKANITIRHSIKFKLQNYTSTEFSTILQPLLFSSPVICLLVPVSWKEMNNLTSALENVMSNGRVIYFVMLHIVLHPGFSAYTQILSPLLQSLVVLTVSPIQGVEVEVMLNSSLSVAQHGWTKDNRLVDKLTVWDWNNVANETGINGQWRPILEIPLPLDVPVKIDPLIEDSWNWAKMKVDPFGNKSNLCDDIDCSQQGYQGFFSDIFNSIVTAATSSTLVCLFLIGVSIVRRFYRQSKMARGPCKIILTPSDFIFPQVQESKRVEEGIEAMLCCWLHQLQELGGPEVEKPDLIKGSVGSLKSTIKKSPSISSISKMSTDPRARYNGDLVQLKLIPVNGNNFDLKSKTMEYLMMLHTLRHENLNPIIGCLPDPTRPYIVWEYCSRGSLEDVLMADEIKLDWAFRLSLLTDLVRGMRYLHSSPAKVHGNLTSRNCVIDARWVLKITDYALPSIYGLQNIACPVKNPKDLLWYAPEFLRDPNLRARGTQAGDVYSFGIVMQEVVVRGEPFCMLSLPPEEILEKIRKPPPLIRPSVSKGAAPPEAINIMRQCWAELPDMRPDFNTIYDLFKTLNHGRKGNIIDTMFQMLEKYSNNLEDLIRERTEQLDMEKKKTEQLLNRMLPSYVADKLKLGMPVDPEEFSEVTIYFSDIVGFTTISAYSTPFEVVDLLNDLYTCFDATINAYNVYKVETIGDAYMVVGGLPIRVPDHAQQIATMALDLLHHSGKFRIRHLPFTPLRLRIGLNTGPCCAGVVGLTMPRYCLFGDTVNTASRMESSGSAWRIHISEYTKTKLEETGGYLIEKRGLTELKGKGRVMTYWLLGKVGFDKQLPTPPPIRESHGLDEQLVMYGRTGIMPNQSQIDENVDEESPSELSPNKLATSRPLPVRIPATRRPVYQLSLDAGLLAATGSGDDIGGGPSKDTRKRWQSSRQMTFDSTSDDCKLELKKSGLGTGAEGKPVINEPVQKGNGGGVVSPFSASEININSPGVSFINQSRSTQNLNGKYRKVDENDLSSQYNYYRCLSPNDATGTPGPLQKASSSRFLRRQFSMDREDIAEGKGLRLFKQNSAGAANDLGRIDEVPAKTSVTSPQFGQNASYKHRTVQSTPSSESLT